MQRLFGKKKVTGWKSREETFSVRQMLNAEGFEQGSRCGNEKEEENMSNVEVEWREIGAELNMDQEEEEKP